MFYLAQQLREDCPHCFFHIGSSLAARGLYEKAIFCWLRALDIDPAYPTVKQYIAQAYRDQGNLDRAREYFLAEIREDPGNVDLLFDMAELELEAGNPGKAAAKLRQVVELEPDYGQAHFALGEVLLDMEEPREALEGLRTAMELDPGIPRLQLRLGQAYLLLSEFGDAARHLSAAYAEEPDDKSTLMAWGNCLLRLGRAEEAEAIFRRVIAMEEESPDAHHNLGVCCFLQGDYETGLHHELRAVELNPEDVLAMHKAVLAMIHLGRWSEARGMIDRVLLVDPEDTALRQLRDRLWRLHIRAVLAGFVRRVQTLVARLRK
jgi:protein O-GlcNAc transferase